MDIRAEKIAKARQKLKDHQERKIIAVQKEDVTNYLTISNKEIHNNTISAAPDYTPTSHQEHLKNYENVTDIDNNICRNVDVNVTEILISTKTSLEMQIKSLSDKIAHLENLLGLESSNHNNSKQKIVALEFELNDLSKKHVAAIEDISQKSISLNELINEISRAKDENNNLLEQLDFTKSMLTTKESENALLHNKICSYQNQVDSFQLQIQQLTNNSSVQPDQSCKSSEETEVYTQQISNLKQRIEVLQKERDQINTHYEHYMRELNAQLKSELSRNETLSQVIQNLYNRENDLIEQISDMEIRIQNYNSKKDVSHKQENVTDIEEKYQIMQVQLVDFEGKYKDLEKEYMNSLAKIEELSQVKEAECNHDSFSINKLNADITSDKIAAQRATEQNKTLKSDVEDLQQVIVKMGKDKLELTEMWTHEKQLNKGLALKLTEVEENTRNTSKQLKAKDEEMIRLQNENRELVNKYESIFKQMTETQVESSVGKNCSDIANHTCQDHNIDHEEIPLLSSHINTNNSAATLKIVSDNMIPKEDAMNKLQERFLNIMDQVANLSDEKHRLEHIILQLQNETDTICEYVALYQQQRSLLKKREEERSNQLKIYQMECDKLKRHLEELSSLLLRFAADHELESFLKEERRHNDLTRVKELLQTLQNCSLINPKFKNFDLNIFYPCNCCSGQIIEI